MAVVLGDNELLPSQSNSFLATVLNEVSRHSSVQTKENGIDCNGLPTRSCQTSHEGLQPSSSFQSGDVDRTSLDVFVAEKMFLFDAGRGKYRISKNIYSSKVDIAAVPPVYFPATPDGFATFVNLDGYDLTAQTFLDGSPYSLRSKSDRKSSVIMYDQRIEVWRRSLCCSGIKACPYSIESCSRPHEGKWDNSDALPDVAEDDVGNEAEEDDSDDRELARQVFFFAQNSYPLVCKHQKSWMGTSQWEALELSLNRQKRFPNWVFKEGKKIGYRSSSLPLHVPSGNCSKLPDFIGCADFGKPGVTDPRGCNLVPVPIRLQGANPHMVQELVQNARDGLFPPSKSIIMKGRCPPVPVKFTGKFCSRAVHGQESPVLCRIHCDVEYHYFLKENEDKSLSWAVVVGFGAHKHTWPVAKIPPSIVKSFVNSLCANDPKITSTVISASIEKKFGLKAPRNTIQKLRYRFTCEMYPFGRSIQALIAEYKARFGNDRSMYVISISDGRESDAARPTRDQVGVSILMSNETLLKKCATNPRLGCDGTFGIVSSYDKNLNFELNSIVAKEHDTGRIFSVMRQLASRKTVGARCVLFHELISRLGKFGLKDPLTSPPRLKLTMASDFETTYSYALGKVLSETFRSGTPLTYIEAVSYGCDVHAKRIIMEKCDISEDPSLYGWAVGTRRAETIGEVEEALRLMKAMGGKWESFSEWLQTNRVAHILWFYKYNKKSPRSQDWNCVFWDTNVCESMNARIKRLPNYLLTNRRGLDLVEAVRELEKMDSDDARNISCSDPSAGIQHCSIPEWRREQHKARKRNADEVIVIEDNVVAASAPKKAKRRTPARKSNPAQSKKKGSDSLKIDQLTKKTEELSALVKVLLESKK